MRIYLAARYSRGEQMRDVARALRDRGHTVTSRWIEGGHETSAACSEDRALWAAEDLEDLSAADAVISFTEDPDPFTGRGGRHVEFGAALALGKRCLVVGPRENVFHCLPQVEVYATFDQMLTGLARRLLTPSGTMLGDERGAA